MTEFEQIQIKAPAIVFPGQAVAHETAFRTAYDLLSRRAPVEALELITPALAEDPGNRSLRHLQAWAFMLRAQLVKAEDVLRGLVEERPDDDWAQHALGRVLERQNRLAEALPHLKLAAVMSDDYDHQAAVYRVEQELLRRAG